MVEDGLVTEDASGDAKSSKGSSGILSRATGYVFERSLNGTTFDVCVEVVGVIPVGVVVVTRFSRISRKYCSLRTSSSIALSLETVA